MASNNGDQLPNSSRYILLVYAFGVVILLTFFGGQISNLLGLSRRQPFFPTIQVFLTFFISVSLVPAGFLIELVYSRWRNRKYQVRYALVWLGLAIESIIVLNATFFAFRFAFPSIFFSHEQSAGLVSSLLLIVALMTVAIAATTRIPRVFQYVRRMT